MPDAFASFPHLPGRDRPARNWLVFGLPWPSTPVPAAPAAYAVPAPVPAYPSRELAQMFAVADAYACRHPDEPVVWFSDLTRWLDALGLDWTRLGVDWHTALDTVAHRRLPGVLLNIDQRTHLVLCDATRHGVTLVHAGGRHGPVTEQERSRLHLRMRDLLHGLPAPAAHADSGASDPGTSR